MAVQPIQRDSSQTTAHPGAVQAPNQTDTPATAEGPQPANGRAPANDAPVEQEKAPQGSGLIARFKSDPRKYILSGAGLLLALFVGYQGIHWLVAGRYEITTDNAYIRADIATIAPCGTDLLTKIAAVQNKARGEAIAADSHV